MILNDMKNKKLIHVATFGQPQGLQGEIKINIHTSNLESFKGLNQFFIEDEISVIIFKSFRIVGKKNITTIEGCFNRNEAEKYKGKKVFTLRESLPDIDKNEYYVLDLIGCKVVDRKSIDLGNVVDIQNFGAGDLMEIKKDSNKNFFIPMNNDNLVNVDLKKMIIVVDPILGILD